MTTVTETKSGADGMTSGAEGSEPETSKPKPGKRTRNDYEDSEPPTQIMVKRARGKQGKLQGVMNMPIEVFTEIAKYLYPLDLILLSRANKFFRQLLMCRSAIQTWRYALSNVPDLPPCPKELCEPQYAALVFSKHCSMCGKQVLRPMDPILQVRLCVSCRDQEIRYPGNGEHGVVSASTTILPQKGRQCHSYCLRKDLHAYRAEYDAVRLADDQNAADCWKQKRRMEVTARWQNAQPLIKFIKKMEEEQSDDLAARKEQRQEEVESRLLKLGWEVGDFKMREDADVKQWKLLVRIPKPLTERNWNKILSQLTPLLENNRKLRLEAEAWTRRCTRRSKIIKWLDKIFSEMEPYARVLDNVRNESICQAQENLHAMIRYTEESKHANKKLKVSHPMVDEVAGWEPFKLLVDADVPMEDFEIKLVGIRPTLDTLLLAWRVPLEELLASLLPTDVNSAGACLKDAMTSSGIGDAMTPCQIKEMSISVDGKPIGSLPLETQSLLRADAMFSRKYGGIHFYPDNFVHSPSDFSTLCHHTEASKIAKAFLVALGNPHATYLQVKAVGPGLSCGRCTSRNCITWRDMIFHFLNEQERWAFFRKQKLVMTGKLTYIFTHDIESVRDLGPVVRMATEDDMKTPFRNSWGRFACVICAPVSGINFQSQAGVVDHVQNVHLIQDPKQNQHYRVQ
ncbi:hypothetical protein FRC12_017729 [Ceratobasidium sp. 428]|nr:hypothetical protein FRC12_017729 [Ceratobasidium sp. 428]